MLYYAGDITVGLTSLSRSPIMARSMANRGKDKTKTKAYAVKKTFTLWACSICGTPLTNADMSKPPKRCSNRKTCGVMFVNGREAVKIKNGG